MSYSWPDIVGTLGAGMIIVTYLALQMGKISPASILFSILNGLGAFLIIVSLCYDFNFSAFMIESFWLLISVYGVYRYMSSR